ncbi:prostaglandin E synthase 2-like protein [Tanacetum coccineum]
MRRATTLAATTTSLSRAIFTTSEHQYNNLLQSASFYATNAGSSRRWFSTSNGSGGAKAMKSFGYLAGAGMVVTAVMVENEVFAKEAVKADLVPKDVVLYQYESCPFCNKVKGSVIKVFCLSGGHTEHSANLTLGTDDCTSIYEPSFETTLALWLGSLAGVMFVLFYSMDPKDVIMSMAVALWEALHLQEAFTFDYIGGKLHSLFTDCAASFFLSFSKLSIKLTVLHGYNSYLLGSILDTSTSGQTQFSCRFVLDSLAKSTVAYLDYYDVPYKVVEVNPLSKKEIKWSDYKKVPILMVDGEPLQDSSAIIDQLTNKINPAKSTSLVNDDDNEEKKWRRWVDDHLVHMLSPNIYRNTSEALESFDYITSNGNFSFTEKYTVKYAGAAAMYFVSKKLKKRYNITDERASLYEAAETWVDALDGRDFLGGSKPNLADLAVFGVLRPIRYLRSGKDMVEHTRIGEWYTRMEHVVGESSRIKE